MGKNDFLLLAGGVGLFYLFSKMKGGGDEGYSSGGSYAVPLNPPSNITTTAEPSPTYVNQGVPRVVSVSRSSSRGTHAINKATAVSGKISIPRAEDAPSIVRINSQAIVAKQLGLPKTLYSVAQPAKASIIRSWLSRW